MWSGFRHLVGMVYEMLKIFGCSPVTECRVFNRMLNLLGCDDI
jgi:hypothetical protein